MEKYVEDNEANLSHAELRIRKAQVTRALQYNTYQNIKNDAKIESFAVRLRREGGEGEKSDVSYKCGVM
jgi:hypothetical protein